MSPGISAGVNRIQAWAPIRICDIGGWTDTWFAGHGAVTHITVTPRITVCVDVQPGGRGGVIELNLKNFKETYRLRSDSIIIDRHPLIEAVIADIVPGISASLSITIHSDVDPGAGTGTSAAVAVALIAALNRLIGKHMGPTDIAARAHFIETQVLGWQSGIQDQFASACGGVNFIEMTVFPRANVVPVPLTDLFMQELEERLLLFYLGQPHVSREIHQKVINDLGSGARHDPRLQHLRELAVLAREALIDSDLTGFGDIMNRNTDAQRTLHPDLVGPAFEDLIHRSQQYGALGCKVNGAGGHGGSITIVTDSDRSKRERLIDDLKACGYKHVPITISKSGVLVSEQTI